MTATPREDGPVICLGGVVWESIFQVDHIPGSGTKLLPRAGRQLASGMAPAAAVTIARLGGRAALWARVGDDAAGRSVSADLAREGVDVSGAATAFFSILVDPAGERLVAPCFDPTRPDPTLLADADVTPPEQLARLMPLDDHVLLSEDALSGFCPGLPPAEALVRLAS